MATFTKSRAILFVLEVFSVRALIAAGLTGIVGQIVQGAGSMTDKIVGEGITFDDVLLLPARSSVVPRDIDVATQLTRNITINIPLISAPMDTVTEAALAIGLAQEGGMGVIHKNMTIPQQCREVDKVKRSENGVIVDPIALPPSEEVATARRIMREHNISGVPIVEGRRLVGILTRRDLKFLETTEGKIAGVMTSENLVTAAPATTLEEAERILHRHKVEKLLLVNPQHELVGLITMRDIVKMTQFPSACRDERGRLRVGAAVGVAAGDGLERAGALIDAEVDVLIVDSAHGHSDNVIQTVRAIKGRWMIDVIAGNVATEQGAIDLIEAGADAVKVGIGPGSICTTRVITGVGMPQMSAVINACRGAEPAGVPVIADGGIRHSGDIAKAIAAGASAVMLGSLFAGLDEAPGDLVIHMGRRYKSYRGMGSQGAMMAGSADRYGQSRVDAPSKLVPEGVEGRVPYRGPLADFVYQMVGGLQAAMGYCGAQTVDDLRHEAHFVRVSGATLAESHPHDITITRESPNYSGEVRADDWT